MTADAVGGVWTYARELIAGLGDDAQVVLAVMGPPPDDADLERLPLAGYEHADFALEWMPEPWGEVARAGEWLLDLADRYDPHVVHLNGYAHASLPFGVPVVVVGHSCVLSWHLAVRAAPAGPEWQRYEAAVAAGLARADALVAPTAAMLDELVRLYAPACETAVIPNGIAPGGLAPRDKRPYVLGVGRAWDEAKNLAALERIAPDLPWPVLVAGDGASLGRVDPAALRTLYGHAAVFAEPARYEPFGLAALEAGLAGCALVLGDIPSLREVWEDAAVYVDPFDDGALSTALRRLARDRALCERHARAAYDRAGGYTRERMAGAYLDLYVGVTSTAAAEAAR